MTPQMPCWCVFFKGSRLFDWAVLFCRIWRPKFLVFKVLCVAVKGTSFEACHGKKKLVWWVSCVCSYQKKLTCFLDFSDLVWKNWKGISQGRIDIWGVEARTLRRFGDLLWESGDRCLVDTGKKGEMFCSFKNKSSHPNWCQILKPDKFTLFVPIKKSTRLSSWRWLPPEN